MTPFSHLYCTFAMESLALRPHLLARQVTHLDLKMLLNCALLNSISFPLILATCVGTCPHLCAVIEWSQVRTTSSRAIISRNKMTIILLPPTQSG